MSPSIRVIVVLPKEKATLRSTAVVFAAREGTVAAKRLFSPEMIA